MSNLNPPDEASDFLRRLVDIAQDPKVRRQARRLVGDCDLAEDLIQETLYALIRTQAPERIINLRAFFLESYAPQGRPPAQPGRNDAGR